MLNPARNKVCDLPSLTFIRLSLSLPAPHIPRHFPSVRDGPSVIFVSETSNGKVDENAASKCKGKSKVKVVPVL
jgi:hypothetical protein